MDDTQTGKPTEDEAGPSALTAPGAEDEDTETTTQPDDTGADPKPETETETETETDPTSPRPTFPSSVDGECNVGCVGAQPKLGHAFCCSGAHSAARQTP